MYSKVVSSEDTQHIRHSLLIKYINFYNIVCRITIFTSTVECYWLNWKAYKTVIHLINKL